MNMKKSIAGVMAGAMAVSAMAATVSADQDTISLTYDLKKYVQDTSVTSKVTVVANYAASNTNAYYSVSKAVNDELNGKDAKSYITFGLDNAFVCAQVNQCYKAYPNDTTVIGGMSDFQVTATPIKNVATGDQGAPVTISWTADAGKTDGSHVTSDLGDGKKSFNMPVSLGNVAGSLPMANYELGSLGYTANAGEYGFQALTAKMTYKVPAQVIVNGSNAWSWDASAVFGALGGDTNVEKTLTAEIFIDKGGKNLITSDHRIEQAPTSVAVSAFTQGDLSDKIYPMKSTLNAPANVVNALSARKAGGNYYTKPVAVINDAIANHENVTFTFTSYDGYVTTAKSHLFQQWVEADRAYGYQTSSYDWYNPTFGQHLYTNSTSYRWDEKTQSYVYDSTVGDTYSLFGQDDYDMYGSYSSAWGTNLFTGAIVVNSGITMQLNDTDKFNWGNNTLTFDWATITDEGKITDAKTFLTSMLLYTPADWYWDNLTVVVGDDENVDAGEGIDGEGDEISDDEETVDETPAEDEVVADDTAEDEAPAEEVPAPAPSPATGNASVALAVIPVALAAAAVVAKKRG